VLFDGSPQAHRGLAVANRVLLTHLLATLGASNLAPNLERLAHEAESGELVADDEMVQALRIACDDVRLMHNALMRGLGKKEKPASRREREALATRVFNVAADPEDSA
jgi:hypothetical protein